MSIKTAYVGAMGRIRLTAENLGIETPRPGERGASAHLRSLWGIHDADTLIRWDVPWWTYRAISAVDAFLVSTDSARVFEYGSGASTIWLARRASVVHTVEHDVGWATRMEPRLTAHAGVTLHVRPPSRRGTPRAASGRRGFDGLDFADYVDQIHTVGGLFDLIIIDGRARMACLAAAYEHLAPSGWVLLDNSGRRRYRGHLSSATSMSIQRYRGAAPGLPYPDETSILRRSQERQAIPSPRQARKAEPDSALAAEAD